MCGIAGFYNTSQNAEECPGIIKNMLSYIRHRGPDEAGYFLDDKMAMGTVRLSIIDLSTGTQPLSDQSKRYWICYNGELYNYKEIKEELISKGIHFKTSSDTEVVLQAWIFWGDGCLGKFNGAFGFSIYDTVTSTLFLARDRYGKRPLFYTIQNGEFLYGSEMKAFFGYPEFSFEMDTEQLSSIYTLWTPLPHQSGFKNVKQLGSGEYLVVNKNGITRKKYSTLNFDIPKFIKSEADAIDIIRETLKKSIEMRLRSDVEVGVYLSGGLDSSIVTQLASKLSNHPLRTFSVEFDEGEFDESNEQKEVASYFNTKHSSIRISHKDITDNFPKALYYAEVPVFRTAFVPMYLLSQKVRKAGIKVVLSGEGSDEAFLGYDIFKETLLRESWNNLCNDERKEKAARVHPFLNHYSGENQNYLLGLYQQYSNQQLPGLFSHEIRFQNGRFSNRLLKKNNDPFQNVYELIADDENFSQMSPVQKAQWLEFKTLLSGYLLSTQGERMGLANGVENRCPFLDPNVVELASAMNLIFDDGFNEKYILKKAFEDVLPKNVIARNKQPYRAPDSAAFVTHIPEYMDLLLSDSSLKEIDFLNQKFCKGLVKKVTSLQPNNISARENQTFMYLISTVLLNQMFVKKDFSYVQAPSSINDILVKEIDYQAILK
jgi:asparagine synthase (glutamine-hydrolysing)